MDIDSTFEKILDSALMKEERLSRTQLLIHHLNEYVSDMNSGTQKKEYFNLQIRRINERWSKKHGFEKYVIKRGYGGGYLFTDEYLRFIGKEKNHKKTVSPSKHDLVRRVELLEEFVRSVSQER